ncbi:prepilin-type N-terminal cleavage/methylation domain-containing protein [Stutzerimonas xanthomarina]|nr:prepilin-type N-terminal cleavage/methylation domain-containing protein [Stutzerimonas nitrititolerans]OCX21667.1 prepilin-type N-terminal cleavage/methylation domain-containing protein [Stutzerimonas xanthomarina]HBB78315.1 prepilin-type N-terminal cleavage/methylation domain-containing protein [Pseudomonas sp.]HCL74651.1 prepilin-type N-terminal cleavage/methylation domain-containing protein [Pseudomonas sp.]
MRSFKHVSPRGQRGFTLVEISLVLVVIGLILGAVSIGKDIQRNAEYTKIKQKFVDQWASAYNGHYLRTGAVVGDSQIQPRLMVNGNAYAVVADLVSGQDMTSVTPPKAICQGGTAPGMSRDAELILHREMDRHGIRMPPGRAEGFEDRYAYLDTNGNPQELQVCFQWNNPGNPASSGNVMVISGLTPDLARALDQMIDGKADSREGLFRKYDIANDSDGEPGVEWAANNTQAYGSTTGTAIDTDQNLDEDQVITVVATYKMNQ